MWSHLRRNIRLIILNKIIAVISNFIISVVLSMSIPFTGSLSETQWAKLHVRRPYVLDIVASADSEVFSLEPLINRLNAATVPLLYEEKLFIQEVLQSLVRGQAYAMKHYIRLYGNPHYNHVYSRYPIDRRVTDYVLKGFRPNDLAKHLLSPMPLSGSSTDCHQHLVGALCYVPVNPKRVYGLRHPHGNCYWRGSWRYSRPSILHAAEVIIEFKTMHGLILSQMEKVDS